MFEQRPQWPAFFNLGYWDIKEGNNSWLLWDAKIKEVADPDYSWFYE